MRHAARTSPTTAPIEPPMAAPRDFELGEPSVVFPGELVVVDVRRDVAWVARPN